MTLKTSKTTSKEVIFRITLVYGFLNFIWGYISDVDIDSEKWRFMGDIRFDIYGFFKMFNIKPRDCKVSDEVSSATNIFLVRMDRLAWCNLAST